MTERRDRACLGKFKGLVNYLKHPRGEEIFTPTFPLDPTETSKRKGCFWYVKE